MLKKIFLGITTLLFIGQSHAQKSLTFDGTNDDVQTNYTGVRGDTNRTFESWIYIPSTAPSRNLVILDYGRNAVGSRNTFLVNTSRGLNFTSGGTNANMGSAANTVPLNKWVHVAFVLNSGTGYLYVDGIQVATNNLSTVNTPVSGTYYNLRLGYRVPGGSTLYFKGEMDEVRIWNEALTVQEIRNWMCKEVNSSHPKYTNLQGYWKMDTLSGTTVKDYSGKNRNGTANNGPVWQNFGAPVGTASAQRYSSSTALSLKHPNGDSAIVNSWTGAPQGIHLYRRDSEPNHDSISNPANSFDSSRHWGVHLINGTNPTYKLDYYYTANSHYIKYGACANYLLSRADNTTKQWSNTNATNSMGTFSLSNQKAGEFMLGYGLGGVTISSPTGKDTSAICDGDSITLSNSTSGFNYQWYKNGNAITGATNGFLKTSDSGLFSLIITGGACKDTSNTLTILNKAKPIVNMGPYSPVCESVFSIPFAGGSPAGGTYSSQFTSGNDFIVKSAGPGSHKITYEFTDQFGCSDTASEFLEVLNLPAVTLAKKADVCADSSVHNLTGGSPIGGNYFVNGVPTNSFDASALGVGKHWIKYIYTDSNNCINADSNEAEILVLPSVSLSLIKKSYCEYDDDGVLDGQNPSGGTFYGNGVNGFNFSPNASGVGNHEIRYVVTDGITGCKNTARDTIVVSARPSKPVITVVGDSLKINPEFDHRWYTEKGGIAGETQSFYIPKKEDNYFARVMNKEGCWSLNSDTIVYRFTSISNELPNHDKIVFYPNPAKEYVQFLTNDNSIYQLKIISMNGAILHSESITGSQKINLYKLESGIYSVQLVDQLGLKSTYKLVVSQ